MPLRVNLRSRRFAFWTSAAVVMHTIWTSAAPVMTYPLYASEWGLSHVATTSIFAIYPCLVVFMLVMFGDVSDFIGRRAAMLMGLAASLAGVFLFAVASNVDWVFVGRALMGIGVGLSASPSTAAVVEFSAPGEAARAGAVTAVAQGVGLGLAVLVGGALIEYAPFPTRLNFWVLLLVIAGMLVAAWFLPRHTAAEAAGRWRPKLPSVSRSVFAVFLTSTVAVTTAYAVGAMMLSLGAQIARELIDSRNTFVSAAAIAAFAAVTAAGAIAGRRTGARRAIAIGGGATIVGVGLLALAAWRHSLPAFFSSSAFIGVGYSLLFSGGLNFLNANAPAHHRAGTLSALYLVAYVMQAAVALSLGVMATLWGLGRSIEIGCGGLAIFAALAVALSYRRPASEG
ncbi:MAG TPA: MFS transporter [Hansschlegelia sp.]